MNIVINLIKLMAVQLKYFTILKVMPFNNTTIFIPKHCLVTILQLNVFIFQRLYKVRVSNVLYLF